MSVTLAPNRNRRVALLAALLAVAMVGVGFAAVPLYRLFCQVTGFAGTPREVLGGTAPGAVAGKTVNLRFDSNVAPGLGWTFKPERAVMPVTIGARQIAFYEATNDTDESVTGRAVFNITPYQAGGYLTKVECFCFTEQTLKPREHVRMPVVFYLDPAMLKDPEASKVSEITLSYTFYPVDSGKAGG